MRKLSILFIAVLLIGFASSASINYQIVEDKVFVSADFGKITNLEFRLPYDAETIESNSDFEIFDFETYKILRVNLSQNLSFSYITETMIEKGATKNFFIMKSTFKQPVNVTLYLPEAGVLMKDFSLIFPENARIGTDGRRVFLEWKNFSNDEIVVGYEVVKDENLLGWYLLIILVIGILGFYLFQFKKLRKLTDLFQSKKKPKKSIDKRKKDVTRNLFAEEKQIIEYLMEKKGKECWTKELARDLNIPKVKLSRKLRNLEQKELIERIPYGNENRIKLLKTS